MHKTCNQICVEDDFILCDQDSWKAEAEGDDGVEAVEDVVVKRKEKEQQKNEDMENEEEAE